MSITLSFDQIAALVAGGSGGLGKAICRLFAEAGTPVIFAYHGNQAKAEAMVTDIELQSVQCAATGCTSPTPKRLKPCSGQRQSNMITSPMSCARQAPVSTSPRSVIFLPDPVEIRHQRGRQWCLQPDSKCGAAIWQPEWRQPGRSHHLGSGVCTQS